MARDKVIRADALSDILQRNLVPVELVGDALPPFTRAIPRQKLLRVYASGTDAGGVAFLRPGVKVTGDVIGGFDIYRWDEKDPKPINMDWYAMVRKREIPDLVYVVGPFKSEDPADESKHWLDELPARFNDVEILGKVTASGARSEASPPQDPPPSHVTDDRDKEGRRQNRREPPE